MDYFTLILGGLLSFVFLLYLFITRNYNYWESRGVPCKKQDFLFGNIKDRVFMKKSIHEFIQQFYNEMKGKPYVGMYEGTRPILVVLDPDLIKLILVKHFDHFVDRPAVKFGSEPYITKMMIVLLGNEWKRTRVACTPAFSSGKLKAMVPLIDTCAQQMIDHLNSLTKEKGEIIIDIKLLFINYTMNAIASTAFGLNLDSFSNKESDFVKYALQIQNVPIHERIIIMICVLLQIPNWITEHLPVTFFNKESTHFFAKYLMETRNYRLTNNLRRNDFLQLLLDAQAASEVLGETDEEISNEKREVIDEATAIAQSVLFFIAGFETSTTHLSMACYELAKNKKAAQEKARRDVIEHWNDDGNLTYDAMNSMSYLDMVLSETLRLYPPLATLERMVTKPIILNGLKLDYGTKVTIPTIGLQHDNEYYPDPESFKPERFTHEEKEKRNPYVYLAFGAGPRHCIGIRFANMNSKICTAYLLKHYEIDICDKTPIPFEYDPKGFFLRAKDDIYLKLTKIKS